MPHPGHEAMAEPVLRRAAAVDAQAAADLWLRSFAAAMPTVRRAHSDGDVRAWFRQHVVPDLQTWVATDGETVVGLLVLDGDEIAQLYLEPSWRGRGVGDRFVRLAKQLRSGGLWLVTFQVNAPARRFYERHGFVAGAVSDGDNEEREPDVRYSWTPQEALSPRPTGSAPW